MNSSIRYGIFLLFFISTYLCSQNKTIYSSERLFGVSRFSRPTSLGSAFTGVADGIETIFYNDAGLADLKYYSLVYSNGFGNFIITDYNVFDLVIGVPISLNLGSAALSFHQMHINDFSTETNSSFHYGLNMVKDISIGGAAHYYRKHEQFIRVDYQGNETFIDTLFSAVDFSLSALFDFPDVIHISWSNNLRCGIHFDNVLGSALDGYEGNPTYESRLVQNVRFGASFDVTPPVQKYHDLNPVSFLIAVEIDFRNDHKAERYSFDSYTPNLGFEVRLFEVVSLRYGRENYVNMRGDRSINYQYPISRIGVGFKIPIHKLINREKDMFLQGDYAVGMRYHQGILDTWSLSQKVDPQKSIYGISLLTQL